VLRRFCLVRLYAWKWTICSLPASTPFCKMGMRPRSLREFTCIFWQRVLPPIDFSERQPHQTRTFNAATGSFWFDPTVFNTNYNPAVFTYGTYPRNYLRRPHRGNLDFAVAKKTAIFGERLNAEFRVEFFNIFNHAEFELPTLNVLDPSFGQISSTYDPRIIQLALRLTF